MPRVLPPISFAAASARDWSLPVTMTSRPVVGVGLRELAAESLRAADDDDGAVGHSLSPFAQWTKARPAGSGRARSGRSRPPPPAPPPSRAATRLPRGCDSSTRRASGRSDSRSASTSFPLRFTARPATNTESTFDVSAKTTIVPIGSTIGAVLIALTFRRTMSACFLGVSDPTLSSSAQRARRRSSRTRARPCASASARTPRPACRCAHRSARGRAPCASA